MPKFEFSGVGNILINNKKQKKIEKKVEPEVVSYKPEIALSHAIQNLYTEFF